ncbi:hypothetical protein LTR28_003301, partial [Elasticomyces elasticus]
MEASDVAKLNHRLEQRLAERSAAQALWSAMPLYTQPGLVDECRNLRGCRSPARLVGESIVKADATRHIALSATSSSEFDSDLNEDDDHLAAAFGSPKDSGISLVDAVVADNLTRRVNSQLTFDGVIELTGTRPLVHQTARYSPRMAFDGDAELTPLQMPNFSLPLPHLIQPSVAEGAASRENNTPGAGIAHGEENSLTGSTEPGRLYPSDTYYERPTFLHPSAFVFVPRVRFGSDGGSRRYPSEESNGLQYAQDLRAIRQRSTSDQNSDRRASSPYEDLSRRSSGIQQRQSSHDHVQAFLDRRRARFSRQSQDALHGRLNAEPVTDRYPARQPPVTTASLLQPPPHRVHTRRSSLAWNRAEASSVSPISTVSNHSLASTLSRRPVNTVDALSEIFQFRPEPLDELRERLERYAASRTSSASPEPPTSLEHIPYTRPADRLLSGDLLYEPETPPPPYRRSIRIYEDNRPARSQPQTPADIHRRRHRFSNAVAVPQTAPAHSTRYPRTAELATTSPTSGRAYRNTYPAAVATRASVEQENIEAHT